MEPSSLWSRKLLSGKFRVHDRRLDLEVRKHHHYIRYNIRCFTDVEIYTRGAMHYIRSPNLVVNNVAEQMKAVGDITQFFFYIGVLLKSNSPTPATACYISFI